MKLQQSPNFSMMRHCILDVAALEKVLFGGE